MQLWIAALAVAAAVLQVIAGVLAILAARASRPGGGATMVGVAKEHHQGDYWDDWLVRPDLTQPPDHELHRVEGRGFRTVARCTCGRWWRGWRALQKWRRHYRETR